jgi:hypothetical protein
MVVFGTHQSSELQHTTYMDIEVLTSISKFGKIPDVTALHDPGVFGDFHALTVCTTSFLDCCIALLKNLKTDIYTTSFSSPYSFIVPLEFVVM